MLAIRLRIYHALKKWDLLQTVAAKLAQYDPGEPQWAISLAYATRRADSIASAKKILEAAAERMPREPMFHFNLACYECQLGNMDEAKQRLKTAFTLAPECRQMALEDEDLKPLWDSL